MSKPILTQTYLKEILSYDPETGLFTWAEELRAFGSPLKGTVAGCIAPDGYRLIMIKRKIYTAGRLAWLYTHGTFPSGYIDHINHDRADNRLFNLRVVSAQDNGRNRRFAKNKSGHMGIEYEGDRKKWRVRIKVNNKLLHLGRYKTFQEAVTVRKSAEREYGFHANHGNIN